MFSVRQKREIAGAVQRILRETNHPELPEGEITFYLHVFGAEDWSYASIRNNGAVDSPEVNPHNEQQDPKWVCECGLINDKEVLTCLCGELRELTEEDLAKFQMREPRK
jgi:hypothetical protein